MIRVVIFAVLVLLSATTSLQATVSLFADAGVDTPGLPGFKTFTLTVDGPDPITAINFVGDGSNDPATGFGFFGPMNQLNPLGLPTIFADNNGLFGAVGSNVAQDSQFKVNSSSVLVPPGLAEEGPNILQAAWAWSTPQSTPIPFVRIVTAGHVCYRGQVTTFRNGTNYDEPFEIGCVGVVPEPSTLLLVIAFILAVLAGHRGWSGCEEFSGALRRTVGMRLVNLSACLRCRRRGQSATWTVPA